MIKKIQHSVFIALLLVAISSHALSAHASEVSGTLSADTTGTNIGTIGSLQGTVTNTNNSSGGGGGGGRSSHGSGGGGNGGQITSAPTGQVLGASSSTVPSPSFPNTGEPAMQSSFVPIFVLMFGGLMLVLFVLTRRFVRVV